ncbi:GNAT family N-acetyltransferase [Salegentibacter maritimus]|uniref:GNAT family N-acetyltransferase n=2 Tax=Salegentibacter maritimus TaxID=2794347 RepID=A0ABS0TGG0_9FLAO|nr:GNAT family N-acetyltransferase [Salegentibacter maritimus]MBI6120140.1 GNAT family N-acetyltransferase [Salegentibacter maritimus]
MNIGIVKMTQYDFSGYFKMVNGDKVMKMITGKSIELEKAKTDFEKLIKENSLNKNFEKFKVVNNETNDFLGIAKLEVYEGNSQGVEIGYMLSPQY